MPLQLIPAIHRATHYVGLYLDELREQGLSQGEAHILAHLAHSGPATIGELHEVLAHKRSTLTSILDRLVERGLVTRDVSGRDRRTFIITVTLAGKRAARRVHRQLKDLEEAVGAKATAADVKSFLKVLALVEEEAYRSTAGRKGR